MKLKELLQTQIFLEGFRRFFIVILAVLWWTRFERDSLDALLFMPFLDFVFIIFLAWAGNSRGCAWQDSLLWLILSRRIHLEAMSGLEGFKAIIPTAWIIWCVAWFFCNSEEDRFTLIFYHCGLTFDAGFSKTMGVGMPIGWEAAPLNILLLSATLKKLVAPCPHMNLGKNVGIFLAGLGWLIILHKSSAAGHMTCVVAITSAILVSFLHICFPKGGIWQSNCIETLALAGLPICIAAIGLAFSESSLRELILGKRLFIAGLHPNILAAWAMGILLLLLKKDIFGDFHRHLKNPVKWLCFLVYGATLFGSGGRSILILWFLGFIAWITSLREIKSMRLMVPTLAVLTPIVIWKTTQFAYLMEWTHNERFFIWKVAWDNFLSAPIMGAGIFPFGFLPQVIDPQLGLWCFDWNYPHSHQVLLEILLWGGLPLLLAFVLLLKEWWQNFPRENILKIPLLAFLGIGFFDFVWYTPALISLAIAILLSTNNYEFAKKKHIKSQWKWPILFFGTIALFANLSLFVSFRSFEQALMFLREGNSAWVESIDQAVAAAPLKIEPRLQKLLWNLSFNPAPDEENYREVASMTQRWPKYYLPWYLAGRLLSLEGKSASATKFLEKSLALEPRDTTGIRWSILALTLLKSGQNWQESAWQGIQRQDWGPALLLDHPKFGVEIRCQMVRKFQSFSANNSVKVLHAYFAAAAMQSRGIASLAIDPTLPDKISLPSWLEEFWRALCLQKDIEFSPTPHLPASLTSDIDNFGIGRLSWLVKYADSLDRIDVVSSAAELISKKWRYRDKFSEDLLSLFLKTRYDIEKRDFASAEDALKRLLISDPGNPWLLERLGDAYDRVGKWKESSTLYDDARKNIYNSRLYPFFSDAPRNLLYPTGDHWTFLFEKALRRFDTEALSYNADKWLNFTQRLQKKQTSLKSHFTQDNE